MPRKEEYFRDLTPEEKLVCLPVDFLGQIIELGDYISYPVYRKGESLQVIAKVRKIIRGINLKEELIFKIWIFVPFYDPESNYWKARKTSMNNVNKVIKLPSPLIMSAYHRPDIRCLVDAKVER